MNLRELRNQLAQEHEDAFAPQGGQRVSFEVLALRFEQIIIKQKTTLWEMIQEEERKKKAST